MKKINVNRDICIGCSQCLYMIPKSFKLVDGKSEWTGKLDIENNINQALENCPVQAISITED